MEVLPGKDGEGRERRLVATGSGSELARSEEI